MKKMSIVIFLTFCFMQLTIAVNEEETLFMNATFPALISLQNPGQVSNRTDIRVLVSMTYSGELFPNGPTCTEAMRFALMRLQNQNPSLFTDRYNLEIELIDDECTNAAAITKLIRTMRNVHPNTIPIAMLDNCIGLSQIVTASAVRHFNFTGVIENNFHFHC